MKYLSMGIMIRHIKVCICFLFFAFTSCKKIDENGVAISDSNMSKKLEMMKTPSENYEVWYYSAKNTLFKYHEFKILIGKDSMKVINEKTGEIICSSEIIKENKSFSSYVKNNKNTDIIKSQLKTLFNIDIKGNIQIIQNSESDISRKGCQFPFYEGFITNDLLIFYDEGYHVFSKNKESKIIQNDSVKEYEYVQFPFDFSDYYDLCYSDDEKCRKRYPSYISSESNKILSYFGIEEAPSEIFMLLPYKGFQPIIIAYTDSDIEGYYLFVAKQKKVISSLQIGRMDGITKQAFNISSDYKITITESEILNFEEKIISKKVYYISDSGQIVAL